MLVNKNGDMVPFAMDKKPNKQNLLLLPLVWSVSFFATRGSKLKIEKIGMKGLKPPYIVLSEHQGFNDYYIAPLTLFPHRANYISDVEGFAAFGKELYRQVGCVATRRFVSDVNLIENIDHVVKYNEQSIVIFPEARHSNVGTNSKLPDSIGKLIKRMNLPVVLLKMHGSYLMSPIWDENHKRKVPLSSTLSKILSPDEISELSPRQIATYINEKFEYDEYRWQFENKIEINYEKRAEGLHKMLYKCPRCKKEDSIKSYAHFIECEKCGKVWLMDQYGQLEATEGSTEFYHIPDWYEYERAETCKEIAEGQYELNAEVKIEALPNEKGFVFLGNGRIVQTKKGFELKTNDSSETLLFSSKALYSVHTEYNYRGKGDCIVLSKKDCCYYLYPIERVFNVTKIMFATEEFHRLSKLR